MKKPCLIFKLNRNHFVVAMTTLTAIQINVNLRSKKLFCYWILCVKRSFKMSEKSKTMPPSTSKVVKTKRPSTVSTITTSSRGKIATAKETNVGRPKSNKNTTILGEADVTMMRQEVSMPDFNAEHRQIAYGKFLRAMLEDCLVDEKIELEQTKMDIQMAQLADRFEKTVDHLDKTNRRLKDISFVVEQKRLLDLKNQDSSHFYSMTESSNAEELLQNLSATEQACLDKLETKNIDFGYNKDTGHKQLLDAVNDAIEGLEQIKKHSNLDIDKFKEYEKSQKNIEDLDKDRFDLESLKSEFESKFPKFNEKLLKEVSDKIAKMMDD
ncbi:uncharacterized protein LOC131842980 [Achroia grisella]|uniref:uncharacterized protein LOC131842980 n=1 Tax=Achroia grisella TaxID=688607 RepID=UPI0027D22F72|nr:uncharacterized protein LOC131842980 [Achroia grisella]